MDQRNATVTPYFVAPGLAAEKRILLISFHAPPSNAVGARRWAGMAGHLYDAGWGLDVIAMDPTSLVTKDEAALADLPPGTRLFGVRFVLPTLDRGVNILVRARRRLRSFWRRVPVADADVVADTAASGPSTSRRWLKSFHTWRAYTENEKWARSAAVAGRRIFDPSLHRWVASSGPPHMSHEGGRLLASWTGLPMMADFRDPWRFHVGGKPTPTWFRIAEKYEKRVVRSSALAVTTTEGHSALMASAYPETTVVTITNGMDEDPLPATPDGKKFIVGYPGTIYLERDPAPLFEAVGMLVRKLNLAREDLGLEFMGFYDAGTRGRLESLAATHGVEAFLRIHTGQPRPRALEFMASCATLAVLQQGSTLAIPAKLFECLRFPAWLLVLGGLKDATALFLQGTEADVLDPADIPAIHSALLRHFLQFRRTGRPLPIGNQERFSRRAQVLHLLECMSAVEKGAGPVGPMQLG